MSASSAIENYPGWMDVVWLASDSVGHIAAFASAGHGPIPAALLCRGEAAFGVLYDSLEALPRTPGAQRIVALAPDSDFVRWAERGAFAFDWSDIHRVSALRIDTYELYAAPAVPALVSDLSAKAGELLKIICLPNVRFAECLTLDVRKHLPCVEFDEGRTFASRRSET